MKLALLALTSFLTASALAQAPTGHPDTTDGEWTELLAADLSNAIGPKTVWTFEDGILTASEDEILWTARVYGDAVVDLEFRMGGGANSGVFVYASDLVDWVERSVEVQILDNAADQWQDIPDTWKAGAVFGHKAASPQTVKPAGEWNRMTIKTQGRDIWVVLNERLVTHMNLDEWTSAETNPDGTEIPDWLSKPKAELPSFGHVGLQGKHGGAPIYFRNLKIKSLN